MFWTISALVVLGVLVLILLIALVCAWNYHKKILRIKDEALQQERSIQMQPVEVGYPGGPEFGLPVPEHEESKTIEIGSPIRQSQDIGQAYPMHEIDLKSGELPVNPQDMV